jgi:hypothetical protein
MWQKPNKIPTTTKQHKSIRLEPSKIEMPIFSGQIYDTAGQNFQQSFLCKAADFFASIVGDLSLPL